MASPVVKGGARSFLNYCGVTPFVSRFSSGVSGVRLKYEFPPSSHAPPLSHFLADLTNGANAAEWNSLFNGQLDGMDSLDPNAVLHADSTAAMSMAGTGSGSGIDR